jgi:hypothetical protein
VQQNHPLGITKTHYCLLLQETDDLIAAQSCIDQETLRRFDDECTAKREYKLRMCEIVIAAGTRSDSASSCLADKSFVGNVVLNDGIQ